MCVQAGFLGFWIHGRLWPSALDKQSVPFVPSQGLCAAEMLANPWIVTLSPGAYYGCMVEGFAGFIRWCGTSQTPCPDQVGR